MQIIDNFHNCPEQQKEQQPQQSDSKDLGSKFLQSKRDTKSVFKTMHFGVSCLTYDIVSKL